MKMDGKTVLITGSTDGVGRYVAAKLDQPCAGRRRTTGPRVEFAASSAST